MTESLEQSRTTTSPERLEFAKLEFEQAVETYRTQFTLVIHMITALVIANITVVGFAIGIKIAGLFLICTIFPLMILYMLDRMNRFMLPIVYTAVSLEQRYGGDKEDWLMSTFLATAVSVDAADQIRAIGAAADPAERMRQLRSISAPVMGAGKGIARATLITVALGQLILPIVLTLAFNWEFL